MSSHVDDFNTRNKVLTAKQTSLSKFYRRHFDIVSTYNVGLKTLLLQGLSEHEFYGDLVYKFRKIIGKNDLPYHFKKIIVRDKKIGYNRTELLFLSDCSVQYMRKCILIKIQKLHGDT